jgi:putative nucleotidyltransferase with HDIG domain
MGGDTLLSEIRQIDEYTQIIIITGFATLQSAITTMKAGAFDYITKPFRLEAVGHSVQKAMEHVSLMITNRHLQENSLHVLEAMVKTIEQRDYYTAGHSLRVTAWADAVAEELALAETERRVIHLAGLIHDVGKIGIDDSILRKPGSLTFEEFEVIKSHPEKGVNIVEPLEFMRETIPIIRHHHERYDGTGYPERLAKEDIPLGARILTVADTFDAITSSRAYRDARSPETAIDELRRCSGSQFDPDLVAAFLRIAPNGAAISPA